MKLYSLTWSKSLWAPGSLCSLLLIDDQARKVSSPGSALIQTGAGGATLHSRLRDRVFLAIGHHLQPRRLGQVNVQLVAQLQQIQQYIGGLGSDFGLL